LVVDAEVKKNEQDHPSAWGEKCAQETFDRTTLVEMSGLATSRDLAGRCQGGYAAIRISQQLSVVRTIGRQQSSTCLEQVTEEWPSKHSHTLA